MMRPHACATWFPALLLALPLVARGTQAGPAEEPLTTPAPAEAPATSPAPDPSSRPPPAPPPWRVSVALGSGTAYGHSYVMFGGDLGHQVGGGFELSVDGQYWAAASPKVGRLAPGLNWYAPVPFHPYLGVYYARLFIRGQPDQNVIGGRAGLMLASTPSTAFGAGLAFEQVLDCSSRCQAFWPELSIGYRF